jgi:1-acyl-sn-glycerol-3-phosphate acyltransferase
MESHLTLVRTPSLLECSILLRREVLAALGTQRRPIIRTLLGAALAPALRRFSGWALNFDAVVAKEGFPEACRGLLPRLAESVTVLSAAPPPQDGPLLIASNHPGGVDGLALAAALRRRDVRVVATGMGFLRHLPATAKHLIFSSQDTGQRIAVVRGMLRHLRNGGAVIIFPTGTVDPDPELMSGLESTVDHWSPSLSLLLERVPETRLLAAVTSGVLLPWAYRHPLPALRRLPRDQQKAAEIMQIAWQAVSAHAARPKVHVSFGVAIHSPGGNLTGWIRERGRSQITAHTDWVTGGSRAAEAIPLW